VLETVQSGGVIAPPPLRASRLRTAVLPFANLTGNPEEEYLADGFTQEMITQLGRLHPEGLSVIARTSVMRYKTGDTPVDKIGKELSVDYVLEGSTQREAGRVRITAELIDVRDQTQLWADSYERELSGILAVQREVAREVAEALAIELLPAEQARLISAPTVDPEAHDAYLKGTYNWQKLTPEGLDNAQRYFDLALDIDPDYAPAYEGLAIVWGAREQMGFTPPEEAGPKSMEAALRAVELDDESAKAHEALAMARTWRDWDWAGAWPEWRRSLELDPNGANAHAYYAHFLAIMGRVDEAIEHSEQALELDPFNPLFHSLYSVVLCYQRRDDDALAAARTALAMQPDEPVAHFVAMYTETAGGRHAEAVAAGKALSNVVYGDPAVEEAIDQGWAQGGHREAFRRGVTALARRFRTSFALPADIALFCMAAGEHDQALEWLEQGFDIHDPGLPYLGLPAFDPLHSDPRFQDLVRRLSLPDVPSSSGGSGG
jgi:TolB-like protein